MLALTGYKEALWLNPLEHYPARWVKEKGNEWSGLTQGTHLEALQNELWMSLKQRHHWPFEDKT
jgi:hypothetical protein